MSRGHTVSLALCGLGHRAAVLGPTDADSVAAHDGPDEDEPGKSPLNQE
jgi:hypothetical protein